MSGFGNYQGTLGGGASFGGSSNGFGSTTTSGPSSSSSGFGAPPSFGMSTSVLQFGSSPNVVTTGMTTAVGGGNAPFGSSISSSSTTTMTSNNPFSSHTNNSTFGDSHRTNNAPFGTGPSQQQQQQPPTPFLSSSSSSSFALPHHSGSVMSPHPPPPPMTPFGTTTTTTTAFATSMMDSSTPLPPTSFGMSSTTLTVPPSSAFPNASSITTTPNPFGFGGDTTPLPPPPVSTPMTFAMSSNVMNHHNHLNMMPFGASSNNTAPPLPPPQNTPFASRYSSSHAPVPNPFATSTATTNATSTFHHNQAQLYSANSDGGGAMSDDDVALAAPATTAPATEKVHELAQLQAKIAAKKKKIEEKKLREAAAASLRATATSFVPTTTTTDLDTSMVAQRNAIRFAESNDTTTRSQLPSDLLDAPSAAAIAAQTALRNAGGSTGGREHLENAVSLVGTCRYMCPDEELLRREREGDIQLLERPDGQIHPESWTLRDTMVKRFRRSAADYKLDVPEWIRPPDVLENVCGYLEEWVMERDRQGPDPRYKNVPAPPPLDVYQFVWDRTRMVRKDFILQNFVGTGGLVDARAVRCHERIARWHCLCEHQLSHISEYVLNQSQQNVQELGQTMKTLNQFYDDSMGRALLEVPDETGRETRTNLMGMSHGCGTESVQGQSPVDYDGTAMVNDTNNVTNRFIGAHAVTSGHHGTAEPEMRGLYILLTIDNDGGLEVNKYASRLFEERPEVYQTKPVQLALSVYKAKIDRNYAKFFSILRSPSTPYLFACLMYKHVATMRKNALYLMQKTYGGKTKDGGNMYDAYPLRHLTSLLCFEDDDEARTACRHYNITVKTEENGIDAIYWKATSFRERKDPEKGTVISLRPKKMIKTIEGKLKGATRLAVCRGELSGAESYLSPSAIQIALARYSQSKSTTKSSNRSEYVFRMKEIEQKRQEEDFEARQHEILERQKREELQRAAELENRRKLENEMKRRMQVKEQEKREAQLQLERENIERKRLEHNLKLEQEEQRRMEEELLLRQEAERKKQAEQERQEALRLQRENQIKEEFERNRRIEEERERQRVLELERARKERLEEVARQQERQRMLDLLAAQEFERQRQEAEKLRLQKEKQEKLKAAHKIAAWIWGITRRHSQRTFSRIIESLSTLKSIRRPRSMIASAPISRQKPTWMYGEYCDRLGASLAAILSTNHSNLNILLASKIGANLDEKKSHESKSTILLTLACIFPMGGTAQEQQICRMLHAWLQSRFTFNEVCVYRGNSHNVRITIVDNINSSSSAPTCDAAIFIVPPPWADDAKMRLGYIRSLASFIDDDIPRLALVLFDRIDSDDLNESTVFLSDNLSGRYEKIPIVSVLGTGADKLEESVLDCIEKLGSLLDADDLQKIDRMSVSRIILTCVTSTLWMAKIEKREDIGAQAASAIQSIMKEILTAGSLVAHHASSWPSNDFASAVSGAPFISDYFFAGSHLPIDWASPERFASIGNAFMGYANLLEGPLPTAIRQFTIDAPIHVRENCQNLMDQQFFKRCLLVALQWRMTQHENSPDCQYVYLPEGMIEDGIQRTMSLLKGSSRNELKGYSIPSQTRVASIDMVDTEILESENRPSEQTPITTVVGAAKRRRFSDSFTPVVSEAQQPTPSAGDTMLPNISTEPKRRRTAANVSLGDKVSISRRISHSMSFTKKLESLLHGTTCVDLRIGTSLFLSAALADAPPLITEVDNTRSQYGTM